VLIALGMLLLVALKGNAGLRIAPTLIVLLGAVLLVPIVLGPLARVLGAITRRLARGVGEIAVMHLVKERSRSAYTLALVMVVFSMTIAIGTANLSMSRTVDDEIDRQIGGAIQVGAPGALQPGVENELAGIDGVDRIAPVWFGQIDIDEPHAVARDFFTMIDAGTYFSVSTLPWIDGSDSVGRREFARGHAIVLPEQTAVRLDVRRGDQIHIRTTQGVQTFRVVGTFGQIGNFLGPVVSRVDAPLFGAGRPNGFLLTAKSGVDRAALADTIKQRLGAKYSLQVQTTDDLRDAAHAQLSGFFSIAYALLLVAALVGVLGLANTMVVSVLTRTREVGILRSGGTLRRQARAMVLVEATTLALVAYLLSLPLGWLLSTGIVASQRPFLGTIQYAFAWYLVPVLVFVSVIVAAIASLVPARRIGRLEIVDALRFD
jgi:putative ABC transport system permease protein